ncbi:MAG: HAMP domain-containing sensor histidine kinase [Clostridium sp.]|uniref:HAMP domain-containing sensor histidine kinase n=1 Tax=Clostridium sp. TaxID=1506 RepID=UPI003F3912CE
MNFNNFKNSSLSRKIFFITFFVIIGLLAIILIAQSLVFESFYEKKKTDSLISAVNKFKIEYSGHLNNNAQIYSALKNFETVNGAKIAIFSLNGELKFIPGETNADQNDVNILKDFCSEILKNKIILNNILGQSKTVSTSFYEKGQYKNIGIASAISTSTHVDSIILCVSSIQPILEASNIISEFYIYIFLGATLLAILVSYGYSKKIAKPLVQINNVAIKMSNMDFSETCAVKSDDEIGHLAKTFNFLSSKLKSTLDDLKESNSKLKEDIERERQLEVMRKDFIASVSHELKTPIGIIEGYAEGLKDGVVSGEDASLYLQTIIDESQKMGKLVSNMLELSKLESGVITPQFEIFNINRLAKKIFSNFNLECNEKNITMIFDPQTEYSYIKGDIFQIDQVLTNIISNAIKYSPEKATIKLTIRSENEKFMVLSLLNTDSFIPENECDNLFNKFYRLDKSGNRSKNSAGLGLSIVKNILDIHNFSYKLESTAHGVLFTFKAPLEIVEDI